MSRDRVHFTIPCTLLYRKSIQDCITETLGISRQTLIAKDTEEDLHIICRPSQFARFIILRHIKYGDQNNMACLNMRLVTPPKEDSNILIDVSRNPNIAGDSNRII